MRRTGLLFVASMLAMLAGCTGQDADRASGKPALPGTASPTPLGSSATRPSSAPPRLASPKPNFVVTTCRAEGIGLRLGPFSQGPKETTVNLYLKHVRGPSCTLSGFGSLALYSGDGSEVATVVVEEAAPAPATITLKPGREAVKRLRWSHRPAADEPQNGPCATLAVVLSVRLTAPSVSVDLYTKSSSRPDGIGAVCNHGRLMHTAWRSA